MRADVCGGCKFWQAGSDVAAEMGECRRRPPRAFPLPQVNPLRPGHADLRAIACFPPTHATAWCGEFEESDDGDGAA